MRLDVSFAELVDIVYELHTGPAPAGGTIDYADPLSIGRALGEVLQRPRLGLPPLAWRG
jgi:hypothetical protein